ncbi:MAG: ATP-binding protein [Planctomycetota bacterium]|nr:MAG: ATP-binding protein [Planctomycetota bacterium]
MKVLAALQNGALAQELAGQGADVVSVRGPEDLEAALGEELSFAVVDPSLPFATDVVAEVKTKVDGHGRDRLPVIAVGPRPEGVPYCVPDLHYQRASGEDLVRAAKAIMFRRARQRRLFDQELILKVPTTPEAIDKAGDLLDALIVAAGFPEEEAVKLGHTVREAIGNAAEHGNKNRPERTIHINALRSSDRLTFVITDEGPGFDTEAFLARAEEVSALEHTRSRRENETRPGGLGVFIMKKTCDAIAFNASGNSIYLMKLLPQSGG